MHIYKEISEEDKKDAHKGISGEDKKDVYQEISGEDKKEVHTYTRYIEISGEDVCKDVCKKNTFRLVERMHVRR